MDWKAVAENVLPGIASFVTGWAGQHFLKAPKGFNTNLAHLVMLGAGFGFYAAGHHDIADPAQWFLTGLAWTGSLTIAGGSLMAGLGLAAKTDSR